MATGDDKRSKYLLSKEALPKIDIPARSVHARREFALPSTLRGDVETAADPAAAQPEKAAPAAAPKSESESAKAPKAKVDKAKKKPSAKESSPPQEPPRHADEVAPARQAVRAALGDTAETDEEAEGDDELGTEHEPAKRGGLFYLLIVALLALAIGVVYWFATRSTGAGDSEKTATTTAAPRPAPASPPSDQIAPKPSAADSDTAGAAAFGAKHEDEVEAAPAATYTARVETEPAEATVELVGTDLMGTAPMTFDTLDASQEHKVLVSKEGYLSKEVPLDPSSPGPVHVKLDAKPKVLRIETVPDGAVVYIERRRVRGKTTPMEEPVPRRLLHSKRFKVSVRKPGYAKLDLWVPRDEGWLEETDIVVYNLEGKLELAPKQVTRRARPRRRPPPSDEDGQPAEHGDTGEAAPPTDETPPESTDSNEGTDETPSDVAPVETQPPPSNEQPSNVEEKPADEPPSEKLPAKPTPDWQ